MIPASRLIATLGLCVAASFTSLHTQAQIHANFDGGNSTQVVDGFHGRAGDGWKTPWWSRSNGNTGGRDYSATRSVQSSNPLTGSSGNYLLIDTVNHTGTSRGVVFGRQYGSHRSLDVTDVHSVSMLVRYEGAVSDLTQIVIYDGNAATSPGMELAAPDNSEATWGVLTPSNNNSPTWQLFNGGVSGSSLLNSNVRLISGDTYAFTFIVDPTSNRYQANIVNLDWDEATHSGPGAFSSDWLAFALKEGTVGGTLTGYQRLRGAADVDNPTSGQLSIDSVSIIPESGHYAGLFGLSVLGFLLLRTARRGR